MRRRRIILKPESKEFERDLENRFHDAEDVLDELSGAFDFKATLIQGVALESGIVRKIPHGLGRPWKGWRISNLEGPSSTGRIEHVVDDAEDRSLFLWIKATGWGATITVNVEIY